MNVITWIVLILNGISLLVSFIGVFAKKTISDRIVSATGVSINSMTIYLMLYILGVII